MKDEMDDILGSGWFVELLKETMLLEEVVSGLSKDKVREAYFELEDLKSRYNRWVRDVVITEYRIPDEILKEMLKEKEEKKKGILDMLREWFFRK